MRAAGTLVCRGGWNVKRTFTFAVLVLLFLLSAQTGLFAAPKRISLVMDGSDESLPGCFNNVCAEGLKRAQARFGAKRLQTYFYNALNDRGKRLPMLRKAASGSDIVVIASEGYNNYLASVVKEFPSCLFVTLDENNTEGVAKVVFREEEGGFLAGVLAALMTERVKITGINSEKVVGIIMGKNDAVAGRFRSGFTAGVWYVSPEVRVLSDYTGDFTARDRAAAIALDMSKKGADVIFLPCGEAALGAVYEAERAGFYTIAADSELEKKYPDSVLTSVVKRTGYVIYRMAEEYVAGRINTDKVRKIGMSLGIAEDCIDISTWTREAKNSIPREVRTAVEDADDKIKNGLIRIREIESSSIKGGK